MFPLAGHGQFSISNPRIYGTYRERVPSSLWYSSVRLSSVLRPPQCGGKQLLVPSLPFYRRRGGGRRGMFVTHSVTEGGRAIFAHNRHNRPPLGRETSLPLTKPDINRKEECESLLPPFPFSSSSTIDISQSVLWPLSPLARPLPSSRYPFPGEDKGHPTTPLPFPPFPLLPCDPLFATQRLRRGGIYIQNYSCVGEPACVGQGER